MQINVIPNGSTATFNMLLYPDQHVNNQSYIQSRIAAVGQQLSGVVSDFGNAFLDRAKALYEQAYNSELMMAAKAAIRGAKGMAHPNSIVPLESIEELQSAQPVMQRYLMAMPYIRQMHFDQRIDGYADTYKNLHGTDIGHDHYDFRRVTNGILVDDETHALWYGKEVSTDPNAPEWTITQYIEDLVEGDRELNAMEQTDILNAWSLQAMLVAALKDPTNIFGGTVGA